MRTERWLVPFIILLFSLSLFAEDNWDSLRKSRGWSIWERTDPIYSTRHFKYSTSFEQSGDGDMTIYINLRQLTDFPTYLLTVTFEYFETQDNPPETCLLRFGKAQPQTFDVSPLLFGTVLWINDPFKFYGEAVEEGGKGILRYKVKGVERDYYFDLSDIISILSEDIEVILNNPV